MTKPCSLQNRGRITYGSSKSLRRALLPDRPQPQPNMEEVHSEEPRTPVLQRLRRSARHDRGYICCQRRQRLAVSIQPSRDIHASYPISFERFVGPDITRGKCGRVFKLCSAGNTAGIVYCANSSLFSTAPGRLQTRADTCSKHISQMRAVAVRDIANQLSLSRIAPTTSFVRRRNLIFCVVTPKRAPLVAMSQITMNQSFDRPRPDGVSFLA